MKPRLTTIGSTLMAFATPIHRAMFERVDEFNAEVAKREAKQKGSRKGVIRLLRIKRGVCWGWAGVQSCETLADFPNKYNVPVYTRWLKE